MSLRTRILVILVGVVLGWAAVDNGALRLFAGEIFGSWERQEASRDLARLQRRLQDEVDELAARARIHTGSRSLVELLSGRGTRPMEGDPLALSGVDLFYVVDAGGTVLWGRIADPATGAPLRLPEFPAEALSPGNVALAFRAGEELVSGILLTRTQPLLYATVPVAAPDGQLFQPDDGSFRRPAFGAIVLGRFLDESLRQEIAREELVGSATEASPLAQIELLDPYDQALPEEVRSRPGPTNFLVGEDGLLHAYARVDSLRSSAPLVLHAALERTIAERGRASVDYALLSTLASAVLILFVLLRLLRGSVIDPLSTLTAKAVEIGRSDDTSIRVGLERPDEIGQLAGEFDNMLEKLARSREQVIETARLAGMSEIATGVLHNVGNVLNSVNVSANLASTRARELSTDDLGMLAEVLKQHEADLPGFVGNDPRGKHLVPFLGELARALGEQRQAIESELESLGTGIEHIAELVRAQQTYAGTRGVFERASLEREVESALRIAEIGAGVEVVRDFEPLPQVRIDRRKLMEILVNLLQNASQAMGENPPGERRLTVRIQRHGDSARIEVEDTGVGIAAENLTRVFSHGFTTKPGGHGFGLHTAANSAGEMGARLSARSPGPGRGATFWIDIPIEAAVAAQA
jgi:two-component system NtrC family sensor kinase